MGANLSESRALASTEAQLNRFNQVTPFGTLEWTGPRDEQGRLDPYQSSMTQTLSPELQRLFGTQTGLQTRFGNMAGRRLGQLQNPNTSEFNLANMLGDNPMAYGEDARGRVEDATFNRAMNLLRPELDLQQRRMDQQLANQGLPIGGEAVSAERDRFERGRANQMEQLALASVLAGGDEQSRMLRDLLGVSQTGMGQDQLPLQQALQLGAAGQGLQQPQFAAPGYTQVQNMATPGSMPFGQQLAMGAVGALGSIGGGWLAGR